MNRLCGANTRTRDVFTPCLVLLCLFEASLMARRLRREVYAAVTKEKQLESLIQCLIDETYVPQCALVICLGKDSITSDIIQSNAGWLILIFLYLVEADSIRQRLSFLQRRGGKGVHALSFILLEARDVCWQLIISGTERAGHCFVLRHNTRGVAMEDGKG